MKVNGDYKKKYILLEIDDKAEKSLLVSALKNYIEKLTEEIETDSKSEHGSTRVILNANNIAKCMKWRDHIEFMGTDTSLIDFDFYKNGIERFY